MAPYIVVFLIGIVLGMIIEYSMVKDNINSTEIVTKKIKQKNTSGSTQDINTEFTSKRKQRKEKRLKRAKNNK